MNVTDGENIEIALKSGPWIKGRVKIHADTGTILLAGWTIDGTMIAAWERLDGQ